MWKALFLILFWTSYEMSAYGKPTQNIHEMDLKISKNIDSIIRITKAVVYEPSKINYNKDHLPKAQGSIKENRFECQNGAIPDESTCEQCGISYFEPNIGKIIGGLEVVPGSWPAQAFVKQTYRGAWQFPDGQILSGTISFSCGGSLITRYTVLTAAHCQSTSFLYVYNGVPYILEITLNEYYPTWESMFGIFVGTHNMSSMLQPLSVEKVVIHEKYDTTNILNDIAVINLKERVETNQNIQIACIPTKDDTNSPPKLSPVIAVGWGKTSNTGSASNELKNVNLTVYNGTAVCLYNAEQNWNSQICAGDLDGFVSTCQGDSGGGLYFKDVVGGVTKYVVVGLTSYGRASGCTHAPAVYTKVSYYLPWIKSNWKIVFQEPTTQIPTTTKSSSNTINKKTTHVSIVLTIFYLVFSVLK